jgi:hypothetical protein
MVTANLKDVRKMENIGEEIYGFDSVGPPMGPFPLEDNFGMKVVCVLLARSLDPGKMRDTFNSRRLEKSGVCTQMRITPQVC